MVGDIVMLKVVNAKLDGLNEKKCMDFKHIDKNINIVSSGISDPVEIKITGVDEHGNYIEEILITNGTTPVISKNKYFWINRNPDK